MIAQVPIPVANVTALLTLGYTRIEVWHSGDKGLSFQEITSSAAGPAVLSSNPAVTMFLMGGRQLELQINGGSTQTITFDPMLKFWTPTQVAAQINTVIAGLASVSGSQVVLTTSTTGRVSSILIVYNDATDLGWVAGQQVNGTDARIPLINSQLIYLYTDLGGSPSDLYKWRFSADGVNPISVFSLPVNGSAVPLSSNTVFATATFMDATGQAVQRTVIVASPSAPESIGSPPITTGSELPLTFQSDSNGFLQIPLIVGATVRVAIDGTALVREFVVPGPSGSSFDLLQVMASASDPFTVQVPPPFLTRRSL